MAKLKAAARAKLPKSQFAGPGRTYPINDKPHAKAAIRLAPRGVKAGNITPMQEAMIDKKAKAKLKKAK